MFSCTPFTDNPAITPVSDDAPAARPSLLLRMDFSDPRLAVLSASGDLDAASAPRFAELLWPRLLTKLDAIVLDLSGLTFLGVAGLELLASAHTNAHHRGTALGVVNSTRAVDRALAASGLDITLPCFDSVGAARASIATGASPQPAVPARVSATPRTDLLTPAVR